jgi:hypothetical protein
MTQFYDVDVAVASLIILCMCQPQAIKKVLVDIFVKVTNFIELLVSWVFCM